MIAYVNDSKLKGDLNRSGQNYHDVYLEEILNLLGLQAEPVQLDALEDDRTYTHLEVLLIGRHSGQFLRKNAIRKIEFWVEHGGLLVGFDVPGLDHVFGNSRNDTIAQEPDNYSINAYFDLTPHPITYGVHEGALLDQKLLILSAITEVKSDDSVPLGKLYQQNDNATDTGYSAITWNRYGDGFAGFFAFDLAKTVWLLHQGRPLYTRMGKSQYLFVIGNNSNKVPYADEMCFIIQNMIAAGKTLPFLYQLPPNKGTVPDALFYWGGDEYRGPVENSLFSSDWMKEQGLPYHVNIESDRHPMTKEEFDHIRANGHEISAYYHVKHTAELSEDLKSMDFKITTAQTLPILEELFKAQSDRLLERFGIRPGSTLFERTMWCGGAEMARFMKAAGGTADNTFGSASAANYQDPRDNPYYNGPTYGFSCGTAYPFFFYESHSHGNERIDFIEQPITCYELGHRSSLIPPYRDAEFEAVDEVHGPIDLAVKYHMTLNMFYHPVYIFKNETCRKAIKEIIRYIAERRYNVVHLGNNAFAEWWLARDATETNVTCSNRKTLKFSVMTSNPDGVIIKIPIGKQKLQNVTCNDDDCRRLVKREFGNTWCYLIAPSGESQVRIDYSN